jgi:hypothetical protein
MIYKKYLAFATFVFLFFLLLYSLRPVGWFDLVFSVAASALAAAFVFKKL